MDLRDIVLNYLTDNKKGMHQLIRWFLNDVMNQEVAQQAGVLHYARSMTAMIPVTVCSKTVAPPQTPMLQFYALEKITSPGMFAKKRVSGSLQNRANGQKHVIPSRVPKAASSTRLANGPLARATRQARGVILSTGQLRKTARRCEANRNAVSGTERNENE